FDRFGMMNVHKAGKPLSVFVRGLARDGRALDLARDPGWEGSGNRATFRDRELTGAHNCGFSDTSFAGGKRGEVGGVFWRTEEPFGFYADRVGPLTLDDPLRASGRVAFLAGAPDSGM